MNNIKQPIIFWFRNDLRLRDNKALFEANKTGHPIIPVYIFDDFLFQTDPLGFQRCDTNRMNYIINTVSSFSTQLSNNNSQLLIFKGDTSKILTTLFNYIKAKAIYCHAEYAWEEIQIEKKVSEQVVLKKFWGNMLFSPDEIPLDTTKAPFYYTAFKTKVHSFNIPIYEYNNNECIHWATSTPENLPFKTYDPHKQLNAPNSLKFGEKAALDQLKTYFQADSFKNYIEEREIIGDMGHSSLLSPWLAMGVLSPKTILNQLNSIEPDDENLRLSIEKFKDQLIWRDYYRWLFLRYKTKIFRKTGLRTITPPQFDDIESFTHWRNGTTNEPLINALMIQLSETGWMSNRGRMLASYYLSKKLQVNWLWGARYFESQLIDYDVCNNYGNWAYQSGTGTDSRINRSFNLAKQASKYDAKGEFIKRYFKHTI